VLKMVQAGELNHEQLQEDLNKRQRFQLARLLRSTEEILHCAQLGDWQSVESLEKQRQAELAACFAGGSEEDSPLVAEALATLLHMNNQITTLVKKAKAELVDEHQRAQSQKSVADHYHDHG